MKINLIKLNIRYSEIKGKTIGITSTIATVISLIVLALLLYDVGFVQGGLAEMFLKYAYRYSLLIFGIIHSIRFIFSLTNTKRFSSMGSFALGSLLLFIYFSEVNFKFYISEYLPELSFLSGVRTAQVLSLFVSLLELTRIKLFTHINTNPGILLIYSFGSIILIGTLLLLMPKATHGSISFIDALFTSTSAVCVTGLIVVDTATKFTFLGKMIIIFLIQAGGISIMTFTSFFSLFFKGSFSIQESMFFKDMINENRMSKIIRALGKILLFTFLIELIGAVFIYLSIDHLDGFQKISFSFFHSISAYCNAGFSTLTDGLYDIHVRLNYSLHLIISFLIIFGGIGFPIILNYYEYIKTYLIEIKDWLLYRKPFQHRPRIVNVNTKLVIRSTLILLAVGTVLFFFLEYNHSLKHMPFHGKLISSFFNAVTPRTAGFNTLNMSILSTPVILIICFLMWIGASPGSTGGGIKTSTFALAMLTAFDASTGKKRVEIFKREIDLFSIRRAYAMIVLSIVIIMGAVLIMSIIEPNVRLRDIVFECISAFSTVGLSLGITANLSIASKTILILLMFIGRIGPFSILVSFISKGAETSYKYPEESIFIN